MCCSTSESRRFPSCSLKSRRIFTVWGTERFSNDRSYKFQKGTNILGKMASQGLKCCVVNSNQMCRVCAQSPRLSQVQPTRTKNVFDNKLDHLYLLHSRLKAKGDHTVAPTCPRIPFLCFLHLRMGTGHMRDTWSQSLSTEIFSCVLTLVISSRSPPHFHISHLLRSFWKGSLPSKWGASDTITFGAETRNHFGNHL